MLRNFCCVRFLFFYIYIHKQYICIIYIIYIYRERGRKEKHILYNISCKLRLKKDEQ